LQLSAPARRGILGAVWWLIGLVILLVIFGALILNDVQEQLLPDVLILATIPFVLIVGWNAPTILLSAVKIIEGMLIAGGVLGLCG